MIKILKGDITTLGVDAIVNAANNYLMGGGGVDGAIHQAAGYLLDEACSKIGYCKTGDAVITSGFNLKAKYIIHTVGPVYYEHDEKENIELLSCCYNNSLSLAKDNGLKNIAFPCISSGIYGYPIEKSSKIAYSTVKSWIKDNLYDIDVYFVCYSDEDFQEYLSLES